MTTFERRTLRINGIDTVLLEGGSGPTLVYFHGAGTVSGFDFANHWAKKFRVLIPYHPGFGPSADDAEIITEVHDYVLHYTELFDQLGIARFRLVGQSMGGYIATKFAIEQRGLIEKLALVCPIGIPAEVPTVDFLKVPPQDLPALLAYDPQTVIKHLPKGEPSAEFIAERTKEAVTAGRVLGAGTFDRRLPRHMHRLTMPTMLVWGNNDRLTPTAQHKAWMRALPRATIRLFDDAGHLVLDEAPAAVTAIGEFFGTR
ncbi:MAG TPA: alpha/beta hydrolase [Gammaproteobacteria bacterium]|jgi:pimeloyl-ACP methyl ester carboxylesterase|nr:alpha/beta hydrolase [Gammaproteobacteria bacterium]